MNFLNRWVKRRWQVLLLLILVVIVLGRNLNPTSHTMFLFHDQTQAARVAEYKVAINNGQIPPKIAPHLSFNLGYPIFTYYAPAAYQITHALGLAGFSIPGTIQLSFLLVIIVGFVGIYLFLTRYFSAFSSLTGAIFYVTTLYLPLSIFVRGNLAEAWLIGLLPWGFYAVLPVKKLESITLALKVIVLILLLTSHNALSLFALLYLGIFLLTTRASKTQWLILGLGILGSMYFYLPFIDKNSLIWAREIALKTNFNDHFLCINQLWSGLWGFGGSAPGCIADGMSFKLGKLQLLLLILVPVSIVLRGYYKKKKDILFFHGETIFFVVVTIIFLFLTTSWSKIIWNTNTILPLMQYPWRFLAFTCIGFAWCASYCMELIPKIYAKVLGTILIALLLIFNGKYFYGQYVLKSQYTNDFLSAEYINTKVAYLVPEYLPKTVNYDYWRSFEPTSETSILPVFSQPVEVTAGKYEILQNKPFKKLVKVQPQPQLIINVHYLPNWVISVNGIKFIPKKLEIDSLGRPFLPITKPSIVAISYTQTSFETIGLICLALSLGGAILLPYSIYAKRKRN